MTARRTIIGLCMLCALAFSAIAAQSAAAAIGTTAFTCKAVTPAAGTAGFSKEHCRPSDAVSTNANFEHFAVGQDTTTEITGTAETTGGELENNILKATIAGVALSLSTKQVHVTGGYENKLDELTKEHYIHGHEITVTYTNVVVTGALESKCKVVTDSEGTTGEDGVIHTEKLTATSTGQGDSILLEPENPEKVFATFEIVKKPTQTCPIEATYKVTGSVTGVPDGATLKFTHAQTTEKNTLKLGGNKAGYEGSVTIKGKDPKIEGDTLKPLSVTTVETT
jgi:hypothetical protein